MRTAEWLRFTGGKPRGTLANRLWVSDTQAMEQRSTPEAPLDQGRPSSAPGVPADYDSPWKEAIEQYFPAFMAFFFPEIHADIAWYQGYEFLDNELVRVVRDATIGRRYADKLVKVFLRV